MFNPCKKCLVVAACTKGCDDKGKSIQVIFDMAFLIIVIFVVSLLFSSGIVNCEIL